MSNNVQKLDNIYDVMRINSKQNSLAEKIQFLEDQILEQEEVFKQSKEELEQTIKSLQADLSDSYREIERNNAILKVIIDKYLSIKYQRILLRTWQKIW